MPCISKAMPFSLRCVAVAAAAVEFGFEFGIAFVTLRMRYAILTAAQQSTFEMLHILVQYYRYFEVHWTLWSATEFAEELWHGWRTGTKSFDERRPLPKVDFSSCTAFDLHPAPSSFRPPHRELLESGEFMDIFMDITRFCCNRNNEIPNHILCFCTVGLWSIKDEECNFAYTPKEQWQISLLAIPMVSVAESESLVLSAVKIIAMRLQNGTENGQMPRIFPYDKQKKLFNSDCNSARVLPCVWHPR